MKKNCIINYLQLFFGSLFFGYTATAQTGNQLHKIAPAYRISVKYSSSLMPVNDQYELELNGSERIVMDTGHKIVYFSKQFNAGDSFTVKQIRVPRPSNLTTTGNSDSMVRGIVGNTDVFISLFCIPPPLTIIRMNIIGIKPGETFKFSDFYNRTLSTSFSSTVSIGGFPVGDPLIITQAAGPRPCILNPASGTVPNNPVTIQCDCNAKPVAIKPPVEQYDLVTRSSDNKLINTYYESWSPVIGGSDEDEGRYIAFSMYGKGIDGSSGNYRQIFWRDRKTGTTNMISKTSSGAEGNGNSAAATISADGRFVAFESYASNLCTGDQNAFRDVFVWDAFTGLVKLVSRSQTGLTSNGESTEPVISGDGNTIVFTSHANDIVKLEPVFSTPNIYVYNRQTGNTIFITKDYESGKATGGYAPAVSEDGNRIAFCAYSSRLVKNDNNNLWDIFLWQKGVPGLKRISMTETGGERNQGNESASRVVWPGISGDGNKIVFATTASNVVGDDKNGMQDIFLYNIEAGGIKRVSTVNVTTEGDGDSPAAQGERIGISYDGSWITYITNANNLGVPKGNIIKQHTLTGEIIPVTNFTNGSAARPDISKSGNYVVAGCSQAYDRRFNSSGIFVIFSPAHAP